MGISIYYTAMRSTALTEEELQAVEEVVVRYSVADRIGTEWDGEDFCLYSPPFGSPDTVLEGATKLPMRSEDVFWESVQHWCGALSEIRRCLTDTKWQVYIDDHEVGWNESLQMFDPTG